MIPASRPIDQFFEAHYTPNTLDLLIESYPGTVIELNAIHQRILSNFQRDESFARLLNLINQKKGNPTTKTLSRMVVYLNEQFPRMSLNHKALIGVTILMFFHHYEVDDEERLDLFENLVSITDIKLWRGEWEKAIALALRSILEDIKVEEDVFEQVFAYAIEWIHCSYSGRHDEIQDSQYGYLEKHVIFLLAQEIVAPQKALKIILYFIAERPYVGLVEWEVRFLLQLMNESSYPLHSLLETYRLCAQVIIKGCPLQELFYVGAITLLAKLPAFKTVAELETLWMEIDQTFNHLRLSEEMQAEVLEASLSLLLRFEIIFPLLASTDKLFFPPLKKHFNLLERTEKVRIGEMTSAMVFEKMQQCKVPLPTENYIYALEQIVYLVVPNDIAAQAHLIKRYSLQMAAKVKSSRVAMALIENVLNSDGADIFLLRECLMNPALSLGQSIIIFHWILEKTTVFAPALLDVVLKKLEGMKKVRMSSMMHLIKFFYHPNLSNRDQMITLYSPQIIQAFCKKIPLMDQFYCVYEKRRVARSPKSRVFDYFGKLNGLMIRLALDCGVGVYHPFLFYINCIEGTVECVLQGLRHKYPEAKAELLFILQELCGFLMEHIDRAPKNRVEVNGYIVAQLDRLVDVKRNPADPKEPFIRYVDGSYFLRSSLGDVLVYKRR